MARRIEPQRFRRDAILTGLALALLSLALVLPSCRNPLLSILESSGVTIEIDGETISEVYDLGSVKQGVVKSFVISVRNTGNQELRLTGTPLVIPSNSLFTLSQQPATLVKVRGSTSFTVLFNATVPEGEQITTLTIENNSRDKSFSFSLVILVDATPPTVVTVLPVVAGTNIATNVVLSAKFSEDMDPSSITGTSFKVKAFGALAPVAATVSYEAGTRTATLKPTANLDPTTPYLVELTTDITDLAGQALTSLGAPWTFTTGAGTDSVPPTVVSTVPASAATGVAINTLVSVTFNEVLDQTSIDDTSFRLFGSGLQVPGTVSYINATKTATFDPASDLAQGVLYEARLSAGIRDAAGNGTTAPYEWSFTTTFGAQAPTVVARYPGLGAPSGIATNTVITAEFSEPMNAATLTTSTFYLRDNLGNPVAGTVSYNTASRTATFDPDTVMAGNTVHTVYLTAGITDTDGTALAAQNWSFQTAAGVDSTPPTVTITSPVDATTNVLLAANIAAVFSESMDPASINSTTFTLKNDRTSVEVEGTVSYSESNKTATFDPTGLLDLTAVYTATVKGAPTGVKDVAGNLLAADRVWSFTTEAGTSPPTVANVLPANLEIDVDIATTVVVEFSKMMKESTVATGFKLYNILNPVNPVNVPGTVSYNTLTRKATFTPGASLQYQNPYKVECTNAIKDIGGNALTAFTSIFTTVAENKWGSMKWDQGKWGP